MTVTGHNMSSTQAEAFLTLVEPDAAEPEGYRAQAIHLMTDVRVQTADSGRGHPDQVLIHFVTGKGRRVATMALNRAGALVVSDRLGAAAGRI